MFCFEICFGMFKIIWFCSGILWRVVNKICFYLQKKIKKNWINKKIIKPATLKKKPFMIKMILIVRYVYFSFSPFFQIDDFRRLYMFSKDERPANGCEGRLLDNFRPVKPLNGRVVRASFQWIYTIVYYICIHIIHSYNFHWECIYLIFV